jgi:predicted transposase/invertase (TIGR01784 family)
MSRLVKRLDPKLDLVFKLLLLREPALLHDMLQSILARPVRDLTILDRDLPGALPRDKEIILDIRARLDDGSRADIEMQTRITSALGSRLYYYGARDYSDQLVRGDDYALLTPTAVIVWLVDPLFPALKRLHSTFELRERNTHTRFGDQLTLHLLQLSALSPSFPSGYAGQVERWARFLTARTNAQLNRLAAENPIMSLAKQTLDALSQDPATHRRARERADEIKLYKIDLLASRIEGEAKGRAEGEAKGRAKGRAEGEAKLLLKLLALRFGSTSDATRARVEAATPAQIDAWAGRVLTAKTLKEVLAP